MYQLSYSRVQSPLDNQSLTEVVFISMTKSFLWFIGAKRGGFILAVFKLIYLRLRLYVSTARPRETRAYVGSVYVALRYSRVVFEF